MPSKTCLRCGTRNFSGNSKCSGCGIVLGSTSSTTAHTPAPAPPSRGWPVVSPVSSPVPYAPAAGSPATRRASHAAGKIPKGWGTPIVEGTVVDTSQIQISVKSRTGFFRGILGLLLFAFRPGMVLSAWVLRGRSSPEHQPVFILRIERDDGRVEQARIESDLYGATMDLGDRVSIWGKRRGGVAVVSKAFNHTIGAEVRLKNRS